MLNPKSNARKATALRLNMLQKLSNKRRRKYNAGQNTWNIRVIDDIIYNEKSHVVSVFKDFLILDDNSEFLKRFYFSYESFPRLPKIIEYYIQSTITAPNFAVMNGSKIIIKGIKKKQKIGKQGDENFHPKQKQNKGLSLKNVNEEKLFTDKLKESIEKIRPSISNLDMLDLSINPNEQSTNSLVSIFQSLKTITFLNDMKVVGSVGLNAQSKINMSKIPIIKEKLSKSSKPIILDASKSRKDLDKLINDNKNGILCKSKDNKLKLRHGDFNINLHINFNTITPGVNQDKASADITHHRYSKRERDTGYLTNEDDHHLATTAGVCSSTTIKGGSMSKESTNFQSNKENIHLKTGSMGKIPISLTKSIAVVNNFNTISGMSTTQANNIRGKTSSKIFSKNGQLSNSQSKIGVTYNKLSSSIIKNQKGISISKSNYPPSKTTEKSNIMSVFIQTPSFMSTKFHPGLTSSDAAGRTCETSKAEFSRKSISRKQITSNPKNVNTKYNTIEEKQSTSKKIMISNLIGSHFRKPVGLNNPCTTITNFPCTNFKLPSQDQEQLKTLPNDIYFSKGLKITEIINCEKRSIDLENQISQQTLSTLKDNLKTKQLRKFDLNSINSDVLQAQQNIHMESSKPKDTRIKTSNIIEKIPDHRAKAESMTQQQIKGSINIHNGHSRGGSSYKMKTCSGSTNKLIQTIKKSSAKQ